MVLERWNFLVFEDQQFQLISKALTSTQKSLEEQIGMDSPALLQMGNAREDMIKALSHATAIDHRLIIDTLYDE